VYILALVLALVPVVGVLPVGVCWSFQVRVRRLEFVGLSRSEFVGLFRLDPAAAGVLSPRRSRRRGAVGFHQPLHQ
jgi:hypothetical protein